jgi:hypothetical protein
LLIYVSETKTSDMKKIFLLLIVLISFFSVNAQTDTLQQYTGTYVFGDGSPVQAVDVTLTDGALSMSSSAGNSSLTRLGVDSFQIVEFSGTAVFRRSEDKKINAVHIEAMGYVMDGQKQQNGIWIFREYYTEENKKNIILSAR